MIDIIIYLEDIDKLILKQPQKYEKIDKNYSRFIQSLLE